MAIVQHLCLRHELQESSRYNISFFTTAHSVFHDHDYYEFTIVTHGYCNHICNNIITQMGSGDIVFVRPGDVHICNALSSDYQSINVIFPEELLSDIKKYLGSSFLIDSFLDSPSPIFYSLSPYEFNFIKSFSEKLVFLHQMNSPAETYLFRSFVMETLVHCIVFPEESQVGSTNNMPAWLSSLLSEMLKPAVFTVGLSAVYEISGKSPEYISRAFKKYLNLSPNAVITRNRMDYAVQQLLHSDISLSDIASNAGYDNLSTFYHVFKKTYHMSPMQYRKRHLIIVNKPNIDIAKEYANCNNKLDTPW